MADEFSFVRIDANGSIHEVFKSLQTQIKEVLKGMKPPKKLKKKVEEKPKGSKEAKKGEEKRKGD